MTRLAARWVWRLVLWLCAASVPVRSRDAWLDARASPLPTRDAHELVPTTRAAVPHRAPLRLALLGDWGGSQHVARVEAGVRVPFATREQVRHNP